MKIKESAFLIGRCAKEVIDQLDTKETITQETIDFADSDEKYLISIRSLAIIENRLIKIRDLSSDIAGQSP